MSQTNNRYAGMNLPSRTSSKKDAEDVSAFLLQPGLFGTPLTPGEIQMFSVNPIHSIDHPQDVCWFFRDSEESVCAVLGMRQHANHTGVHEVYAFAVHPGHRDQGYGRSLLMRGVQHVAAVGGRGLIVDTSAHPSYSAMHLLLESLDFSLVGRFPDFYYPGEDTLWYYRSIEGSGDE